MNSNILNALKTLDVSTLTREEWIMVGMALKEEGFDCSVWDDWSRNDKRYHVGECQKKWDSFQGSSSPVKGGTIVQMAKERGYTPFIDRTLDWDDYIEYDGDGTEQMWSGTSDLITYLETLFKEDDFVSFVTNDVWQTEDGKWAPAKGVFTRTCGDLIKSLKKHPDDIGATVGDCKAEAGGWIRFNPVDGKGIKNDNITGYKYALVESDTIPVEEQDRMYRQLQLPIACLVHSGGKSLHAIVKVDANNPEEYRKRVEFLYEHLEKNGLNIDRQNRNPSRLSRMPGVYRKGNRQYLVATNIGKNSWLDWVDFIEGVDDELPDLVSLDAYKDNLPLLPEELIEGVLRRGHKMLISGSSKAGKSFLLMELCIAIAEGKKWLKFNCKKGKVLYVNLEIDPASCIVRFMNIYKALGLTPKNMDNIVVWNLRGHAVPLDQLVPKLIRRVKNQGFDAVIIDPIYKVITGDENNASEMGKFCNQFDKICNETGCSTIYCHHHSKGAQGAKKAMDRASGSGVFSRDPDAQLDMIELELSDDIKNNVRDGKSTGWRLESSLREFENFEPMDFWFDYPIHRVDMGDHLKRMPAVGTQKAGKVKNKYSKSTDECNDAFRTAFEILKLGNDFVTVKDIADYLKLQDKAVYHRLKVLKDEFYKDKGKIYRKNSD